MQGSLIPVSWQVPDEFRQRLGSTAGRQRLMQAAGHLLLVLHDVPEADAVTRRAALFWRDPTGTWQAANAVAGVAMTGATALEQHLQRYGQRLEEFDRLEQHAQRADEYSTLLEGLAPISRTLRHKVEVLEQARKAMPDDRALIDLRDRGYELSRWADLLYDDSKNSMDVAVVKRAEEQARSSHRMLVSAHRLNVLAALFFPFATLGAIFGTTLTDNWSWSHGWQPFAIFLGVGMLCGATLATFITRDSTTP